MRKVLLTVILGAALAARLGRRLDHPAPSELGLQPGDDERARKRAGDDR
jgi:hypothetical protein